jgi:hypothetical protein
MTQDEKMTFLKTQLTDNGIVPTDEELSALLLITKGAILNARYPLKEYEDADVPQKYVYLQLQMCIQMYNKRGAEGQVSHSENGISRVWEEGDIPQSLLKLVVPYVGSVSK